MTNEEIAKKVADMFPQKDTAYLAAMKALQVKDEQCEERNQQYESEREHNVALFALDDTGVDGKLPRIELKCADSQEVKELTEKLAKLTPEQRKELNEFIEKGIDDTIRYYVRVGRHKFEISEDLYNKLKE